MTWQKWRLWEKTFFGRYKKVDLITAWMGENIQNGDRAPISFTSSPIIYLSLLPIG
jgi:hypothetical protein